jgi:hypothetical protein
MAVPTKDSALAAWSTNANTRIVASPSTFSLSAADATAFTAVFTPFIAAYEAAAAVGARSRSLVAAKDTAKGNLLRVARDVYGTVQASTAVSDANKELLGVVVRRTPAPIPAPSVAPDLDVVSILANVMKKRIHDASTTLRRKPAGVAGANVFSFVGPAAPAEASEWKFEGGTTKAVIDIVFDAELAPGTQVWLTACWFNRKAMTGPACTPIGALIQFGGSLPMAV